MSRVGGVERAGGDYGAEPPGPHTELGARWLERPRAEAAGARCPADKTRCRPPATREPTSRADGASDVDVAARGCGAASARSTCAALRGQNHVRDLGVLRVGSAAPRSASRSAPGRGAAAPGCARPSHRTRRAPPGHCPPGPQRRLTAATRRSTATCAFSHSISGVSAPPLSIVGIRDPRDLRLAVDHAEPDRSTREVALRRFRRVACHRRPRGSRPPIVVAKRRRAKMRRPAPEHGPAAA